MPRKPGDKRPTRRTSPKGVTLLTSRVKTAFIQGLRSGVPIPVAARGAGMSPGTVNHWLVNGRKAIAKRERNETLSAFEIACLDLTMETERVYEEVHLLLAGRVVEASRDDWRAATWMLQRRHPDVWGGPERIELTGAGGGPIQVEEVALRAIEYLDARGESDLPPGGDNGERAQRGNGQRELG